MRVAVVAEYYPRPSHPGLGVWAHRQALAVRELGAEVRVLVLDRPIPPLQAFRALGPRGGRPTAAPLGDWVRATRAQPRKLELEGVQVEYVRFLAPPRPISYGSWGRWAAPSLRRALDELDRGWTVDVVHAHYAVPAGAAAARWIDRRRPGTPIVVSVHGGDLTYAAPRSERGRQAVASTLRSASAVIVNSTLTRRGVEELTGMRDGIPVIHPGADPAEAPRARHPVPTLISVANLEAHKSQADVIRAVAVLRHRHPELRYVLIGKGPQRSELEQLARSLDVIDRVSFTGPLEHAAAVAEIARCDLHVMPSRHDGFGVAHIDAMSVGVPTIGGSGTGAEDIARAGEGIELVKAGDVAGLVRTIDRLLSDPTERERLGEAGRRTVAERFTWRRCGEETMAVYQAVAAGR
jgi:glycosyltransferase involved in cell wall biosynthesis